PDSDFGCAPERVRVGTWSTASPLFRLLRTSAKCTQDSRPPVGRYRRILTSQWMRRSQRDQLLSLVSLPKRRQRGLSKRGAAVATHLNLVEHWAYRRGQPTQDRKSVV